MQKKTAKKIYQENTRRQKKTFYCLPIGEAAELHTMNIQLDMDTFVKISPHAEKCASFRVTKMSFWHLALDSGRRSIHNKKKNRKKYNTISWHPLKYHKSFGAAHAKVNERSREAFLCSIWSSFLALSLTHRESKIHFSKQTVAQRK